MKKILVSLNEEQLNKIDKECELLNVNRSKYIADKLASSVNIPEKLKEIIADKHALNDLLVLWSKRAAGIKIPRNLWCKDELAEFLKISKLDKEWVLFMDKIDKIYYK